MTPLHRSTGEHETAVKNSNGSRDPESGELTSDATATRECPEAQAPYAHLDEFHDLELRAIRERRAAWCLTPPDKQQLIGLAISGGGIRSATFSLGVLQGLAPSRFIRCVDYLSTVSGGGYTGALLTTLLSAESTPPEEFPLKKGTGRSESLALSHLRNGSNYLRPGGALHTLRLPTLLLRGIIVNLLVVFPALLAAALLTEITYESGYWPLPATQGGSLTPAYVGLLLFLTGAVVLPAVGRLLGWDKTWTWRNRLELLLAALLGIALLTALSVPLLRVTQAAVETPWGGPQGLKERLIQWGKMTSGVHSAVVVGVVGAVVILQRWGLFGRGLVKKLLVYFSAALGPLFLFALFLLICVLQVNSPYVSEDLRAPLETLANTEQECLENSCLSSASCPECSIHLALQERGVHISRPLAVHRCPQKHRFLVGPAHWFNGQQSKQFHSLVSRACAARCPQGLQCWRDIVENDEVFRIDDRVPHDGSLSIRFAGLNFWEEPTIPSEWSELLWWSSQDTMPRAALAPDWATIALLVVMLAFYYAFYDANANSLHRFYRDRLSRLFLFRVSRTENDEKIVSQDELPLSSLLNGPSPYPLINTALNLHGSSIDERRGRTADFFLFSPEVCGSSRTGYCPTKQLEARVPHLNLATAIAISGAAAAPNMGNISVGPFAFAMALLNLRLSYWLPNPRFFGDYRWFHRARAGWSCLWREALSLLHERGRYVNLSDGGHLENLGMYELLRRGCRTIVVIDGEADPTYSFEGLMTISRLAAIDWGIRLRLDCSKLVPTRGSSERSVVVGEIDYGPERPAGTLIYIKSSMTDTEPDYVRAYKNHHPEFPHESTADQFFDEQQFEVYRALGEHIGVAASQLPELSRAIAACHPPTKEEA